ncbi:MAG: hypothetical protein RR704_00850 [Stenotrophomonas sp.]
MKTLPILLAAAALSGCATGGEPMDLNAMQARYEAWIKGIPLPTSEADRVDLCRNLRVEIAKQKSVADSASEIAYSRAEALDMRMRGGRNVALLESKGDEVGCPR